MKSFVPTDPSVGGRTRQSEKDACDINVIVNQFQRGVIPAHVVNRVAEYGFVPAMNFQDCMNQVREAKETFAGLPSETREFFGNDPGRFVNYVATPEKLAELVKLGLVIPKAPEAEPPVGPSGTGAGGTPA